MPSGNTVLRCLQYAWKLRHKTNAVRFGINASLCSFAKPSHSRMVLVKEQIPVVLQVRAKMSHAATDSWLKATPQWRELALLWLVYALHGEWAFGGAPRGLEQVSSARLTGCVTCVQSLWASVSPVVTLKHRSQQAVSGIQWVNRNSHSTHTLRLWCTSVP